jgi:hypothetical protein
MKTPLFTVHWTSALTGNRNSTTCATKQHAFKEAKALYEEGARNISVSKYNGSVAVELNWRVALRG